MGERKDGRFAAEDADGKAAGCWRGRGTETETHRYMGEVDRWDGENGRSLIIRTEDWSWIVSSDSA
jgi:hypothetical protein